MSWQKQELQRRKESQNNAHNKIVSDERKIEIRNRMGSDLWDQFVVENRRLLPEIRLSEKSEQLEYVKVAKLQNESDDYKSNLSFDGTIIRVHGVKYLSSIFNIEYDVNRNMLIGKLLRFGDEPSREMQTAWFRLDKRSVEVILKYICTGYPFLQDLRMIKYEDMYCSAFLNMFTYRRRKRDFLRP